MTEKAQRVQIMRRAVAHRRSIPVLPWLIGSIRTVAAVEPPSSMGMTWTPSFPAAVARTTRQVSGCQRMGSLSSGYKTKVMSFFDGRIGREPNPRRLFLVFRRGITNEEEAAIDGDGPLLMGAFHGVCSIALGRGDEIKVSPAPSVLAPANGNMAADYQKSMIVVR